MLKRTIGLSTLLLCLVLLAGLVVWAGAADARAPVAENLELETYRGVSVGGALSARDPDGGAVTFTITTPPGKGTVDLDESGRFVYTPEEGRRGKDYFGYQATDAEGNKSQEATVIIRIVKPKSGMTYSDTSGLASAYAAQRLAEEGIYVGPMLNGQYVFAPDEDLTREEFLCLCMALTGRDSAVLLRGTGFADDGAISAWARGYVGAALECGVISGYAEDGGRASFRPDENVSMAEAAVMLDRAIGLTDAVQTWYAFDDGVPAWAAQSAANVAACGLLPAGCGFADETLSRGDAAVMLVKAMELLEKR